MVIEEIVGSLEVGKYVNIVILNGDTINDTESIKDITVEKTIFGGEVVFLKEAEG